MEANQETSEVTNSTAYELKKGENVGVGERVNPTIPMETDVSESSSNAIVTAAAVSSARPLAKEGYAIVASSSSSRVRAPPPFLLKVYDIVRKPDTDSIISWNSSGTSFIVWDPHKFAAEVLGKYFRHNNFSSFICQLNTYGFKKINWDRLEFQNEWFQKGKKSWLKKIKRRNQGTENVYQPRTIEPEGESTLSGKQKKLENSMHEHDALKGEMMKLKEMQENLVKEMEVLEEQAQFITSKRQKMLKYMVQEVLMRKKGLQSTDAAREQGSDGQQSIESLVELRDEGETSHRSRDKSPSIQSDREKGFSNVYLSSAIQEKEKCTIAGSTFPHFNTADYALLEKQLMDDLNCENVPEEERAKLQQNHAISLEDLIAGPADWTEFAKGLSNKARSTESELILMVD